MAPATKQPATRQIAVVTGGNRGIGLEVCRQLGEQGYRVILTCRDESLGIQARDQLRGQGLEMEFTPLDVSDPHSIARLADHANQAWGRLDVLINNAGISLDGFNAKVVQQTLAVNFQGVKEVTSGLLPLLGAGSRIVMVSSGMGEVSCLSPALRQVFMDPGLDREGLERLIQDFAQAVEGQRHSEAGWPSSAYRVSKVALNALTRVLSAELRSSGILVNAVCPGWVRTGMGGNSATRSPKKGAETIVWAATELSEGVTGQFFRDNKPIPW